MSCTTTSNIAAGVTDAATVMYMTDPEYHQQQQKQPSQQQQNTTSMSMEEMLKQRAKIEDQIDCLKKNYETRTIDNEYYLILLKKDYEKCKR